MKNKKHFQLFKIALLLIRRYQNKIWNKEFE